MFERARHFLLDKHQPHPNVSAHDLHVLLLEHSAWVLLLTKPSNFLNKYAIARTTMIENIII